MRLIDADAFVKANKDIIDNNIDTNRYEVTLRELINEAPTVERPHGEWKELDSIVAKAKCSVCGGITVTELGEPYFCPNCGADMREGEQNETN